MLSAEVFRKHLKVWKRGDVKDVVCWCYAQWCDGLSNAARSWMFVASSCEVRGTHTAFLESEQRGYEREQQSLRVSENAKRDGRVRRMEKQGLCICVPIRQDKTTSIKRLSISYWVGRGKLVATMRSSKDDLDECGMIFGQSSYALVRS